MKDSLTREQELILVAPRRAWTANPSLSFGQLLLKAQRALILNDDPYEFSWINEAHSMIATVFNALADQE